MAIRDTVVYELKKGNKVVYVGITNDFERRFIEHSKEKDFVTMLQIGVKVTRETAEKRETERLKTYMKNHSGQLPELNKTKTGK